MRKLFCFKGYACYIVLLAIAWTSNKSCVSMIIDISFPPAIIRQPPSEYIFWHDATPFETKPVSLECEAEEDVVYKWEKNGQPFYWQENDGRIVQPSKGTLVIREPRDEDDGYYQCFASNKMGTAATHKVFLRKSYLNNFAEEKIKVHVVKEGDPVSLQCNPPAGFPKPNITWVIQSDNGALKSINSSRITVDPEGSLHFSNVTQNDRSDGAVYGCVATSKLLNEYKLGNKVKLDVILTGISSAHMLKPPVAQYVSPPKIVAFRGLSFELHCIFSGTPLPQIRWKRKGKVLPLNRTHYLNYGKTLKIVDVDFHDEGTYECTASNGMGTDQSQSVEVIIQAKPYWEDHVGPYGSILINLGEQEDVEVKCNASGVPKPKVTWFMNGVPLNETKSNPRRKFLSPTTMRIENLESADTAVYQCNASNIYGYVFKNIYVSVFGLSPLLDGGPSSLSEAVNGSTVVLYCGVTGFPKPVVKWNRNGTELIGDRFTVEDNGDLSIRQVAFTDAGKYQCFAKNKYGEVKSSEHDGVLEVIDVPNPPSVISVTCDGDLVKIDWQPMGDNGAPILHYTVQYSTNFRPDYWIHSNPLSPLQFLMSLSPWANYTFRVQANNKVGASNPSPPTEQCVSPPNVPYKNPENVQGKGTAPNNLVISWTPMPPIEHNAPGFFYRVYYRRDKPNALWTKAIDISDWTISQYELTNQETFKRYIIKVEAYNSLGQANVVANEVICYSGEDVPALAPTNLTLLRIISSTSAEFEWAAVPEDSVKGQFRGYKIETWVSQENPAESRELIVEPHITRAVISNLTPFAENRIQVRAFNGRYNGPHSKFLSILTPEGVPGPVQSFEVVAMGSRAIYLVWNKPVEVNGILRGYKVDCEKIEGSGPKFHLQKSIENLGETRTKIGNLLPETKYRLAVRAMTSAGDGSPYYLEVKTHPAVSRIPDKPIFIWIRLWRGYNKPGVKVIWIPNIDGYPGSQFFVRYRQKGETLFQDTEQEIERDFIVIRDLNPNSVYEIKVVAVDGEYMTSSDIEEVETTRIVSASF